jgi:hypothetical protein
LRAEFMKLRYLAVVFVALSTQAAAPQENTPNLAGVWRWNPQKGDHHGKPPDSMRAKIDQVGPELAIVFVVRNKGVDDVMAWHYHVGSDDNANEMHGGAMKSAARWQGNGVAIDSVVMYGTDALRLNDMWTLSPDGQTLTFKQRHQFMAEPADEDIDVFEKQPAAAWEPAQTDRPAEQVYKNIQVLKGVPASRLPAVMLFFSKCLGTECTHCHVANEFEKDEKPAKQTARRMLNMVHKINGDNFPDTQLISCWTCHRGNVKPESFPK